METKAKRIGKFNIVDIIAVVLILAAAALVGYKLFGDEVAPDKEMVPVTYVTRVEGVAAELYENCQKHLPSPLMASGKLVGGQIESVEKRPYYVLSPDGEWVEDPEKVTLYFTASTEVVKEAVMTTKLGEQELRIGKEHILKSEYIEFAEAVIVNVQWGE